MSYLKLVLVLSLSVLVCNANGQLSSKLLYVFGEVDADVRHMQAFPIELYSLNGQTNTLEFCASLLSEARRSEYVRYVSDPGLLLVGSIGRGGDWSREVVYSDLTNPCNPQELSIDQSPGFGFWPLLGVNQTGEMRMEVVGYVNKVASDLSIIDSVSFATETGKSDIPTRMEAILVSEGSLSFGSGLTSAILVEIDDESVTLVLKNGAVIPGLAPVPRNLRGTEGSEKALLVANQVSFAALKVSPIADSSRYLIYLEGSGSWYSKQIPGRRTVLSLLHKYFVGRVRNDDGQYQPYSVVLNPMTGALTSIMIGREDHDILWVDESTIVYRIADTLFEATWDKEGIGEAEFLCTDERVRHIHMAVLRK